MKKQAEKAATPKKKAKPARGKVKRPPLSPEAALAMLPPEQQEALAKAYKSKMEQTMAELQNALVKEIGKRKIPFPEMLMVLAILSAQVVELARKQYFSGE